MTTIHRLTLHPLLILLVAMQAAISDDDAAPTPFEEAYDIVTIRKIDGKTYGTHASTPLLWSNSVYPVQGEHYERLLVALDRLAAQPDEEIDAIAPVKRALLQRHLWAVFDWSTTVSQSDWIQKSVDRGKRLAALQTKLAPLIRKLALSKDEIAKLPDTVAATAASSTHPEAADPKDSFKPFFPKNLNDDTGPWVCLTKSYHRLPAKVHTEDPGRLWRSAFHVFIRLPGNREDTLAYLTKLTEFGKFWVTEKPEARLENRTTPNGGINYVDIYVNPDTPQFPAGTQVALVEQALLVDDGGQVVPSPLSVGIQLRHYLRVDLEHDPKRPMQAFAEFVIQPRKLMVGDASMRPVDEQHFSTTDLSGGDPFVKRGHSAGPRFAGSRLKSCFVCHSGWGIHSVNSRAQLFELPRNLLPPRFKEGKPGGTANATAELKQKSYSWGLLEGLWRRLEP